MLKTIILITIVYFFVGCERQRLRWQPYPQYYGRRQKLTSVAPTTASTPALVLDDPTEESILRDAPQNYRIGYTYSYELRGWYKVHHMPLNVTEAWTTCVLEGAQLAGPSNNLYMDELVRIMSVQEVQKDIHTGISELLSKRLFLDVEGNMAENMNLTWHYNGKFPNSESCLVMSPNGQVHIDNCMKYFPYICFKMKGATYDDPNYIVDNETQVSYKFHWRPKPWREAVRTCVGEGGYLSVINSQRESFVLRNIFALHPHEKIVGDGYKESALMGFHETFKYFGWVTIHGQTLEEAGFDKWASGQPSNDSGENCGTIFRDGLLNDAPCDTPLAFICEKQPSETL